MKIKYTFFFQLDHFFDPNVGKLWVGKTEEEEEKQNIFTTSPLVYNALNSCSIGN